MKSTKNARQFLQGTIPPKLATKVIFNKQTLVTFLLR